MIRSIFKFIFRLIYGIAAVVGFGVIVLTFIISFSITYMGVGPFAPKNMPLQKDSVLTINLKGSYVENENSLGYESLFYGRNSSLYTLVRGITQAASDPKIKGLVARIETPSLGMAQIQELRDAVFEFRKSGKPTWVYTDTFGELTPGTGLYYLASVFEQIWMQPLGSVNLTGLSMEVPFGKDALEKLGVKPELIQKKEYKSFGELFTRDGFSEPSKEAEQAVIDSILSQIVDGIARDRKFPHDQVRLIISNGPYLTEEALTLKLIDRIDYRQNLTASIKEKFGKDIEFVSATSYVDTFPDQAKGDKVALIFGSGNIVEQGGESAFGSLNLDSDGTYKAFQTAIEDKDVKSIVYRINSGGGSPTASETIYSIIRYAKEKAGKPVIISMSDAAASGAYWIAVAGTKIIAQPATLTGSIGTFGGKFNIAGLSEKLGVKWGHVFTSDNALMWSGSESYSPAAWVKINAYMDQVYDGFTSRVAQGRKMTPEQVEKVARGRVWTGEQALALGLVDQLGGLNMAIDLAKKAGGLGTDAGVQIYPQSKSVLEKFFSAFDKNEGDMSSGAEVSLFGSFLRPFRKVMAIVSMLMASEQVLYAPLGEIK